jgi:hypothetical protein
VILPSINLVSQRRWRSVKIPEVFDCVFAWVFFDLTCFSNTLHSSRSYLRLSGCDAYALDQYPCQMELLTFLRLLSLTSPSQAILIFRPWSGLIRCSSIASAPIVCAASSGMQAFDRTTVTGLIWLADVGSFKN